MKVIPIIVGAVLIIIGAFLLQNAFFMVKVANFNSGVIFTAVVGLAVILYGFFLNKLRKLRWLNYIIVGVMIFGCCLITFIVVYGKWDNVTYDEDALIVLGAAVNGESVTYPLYTRLERAVAYHGQNPEAVIVVSGGQGFQESITEALAMERYLLGRGVPEDRILKEEQATSTYENFKYSKELLDERFAGGYKIALVTNDFHVFRATRVAKSLGLNATHCQSPILWHTIPTNYLRECAAVLKELLIGSGK